MAHLTLVGRNQTSRTGAKISLLITGLPHGSPAEIFYEIAGPDAPTSMPVGNFAVAAALPLAMSLGGSLHYCGQVDSDFLQNIEDCMDVWHRWLPDRFQRVRITSDSELEPKVSSDCNAVMAFSGGLDAAFALHANKANIFGRRNLNIEAGVLIQGFDLTLDDESAFGTARHHASEMLKSYGVRLNTVRTNWRNPFCVHWGATHMLGITSVLQLFHGMFGAAVFADDVPYESQVQAWSNNAITNRMMGSAAFPVRSFGAAFSRTEKALAVAGNPIVLDHLRVCWERRDLGGNCGTCEKCVRTKMNFYAAGVNCVPALGAPVTAADLSAQRLDGNFVYRYSDMLKKGTWAKSDRLRAAVADMVRRCEKREISSTSRADISKPRGFLRRTKAQMSPLLRGFLPGG